MMRPAEASEKDPRRWDEPTTPTGITKRELTDYYSQPEVQQALFDAVRNRNTAIVQSFDPAKQVFRRYGTTGEPIRLGAPGTYHAWLGRRLAEVHPAFGTKEDILLADVDPGPGVPWERTKQLAGLIAARFAGMPEVAKTSVQFTGGRGFHVKGHLSEAININEARRRSQEALLDILRDNTDTTLGPRKNSAQVRLDTTPLHRMGSTRAPYSLNVQTGLVAAPVTEEELPEFQPRSLVDILRANMVKTGLNKYEQSKIATRMGDILRESLTDPWGSSGVKKLIKDKDTRKELVAIHDASRHLAGFIHPSTDNKRVGYLYVEKNKRNQSLATKALKQLAKKHPGIASSVNVANPASIKAHERAGFRLEKKRGQSLEYKAAAVIVARRRVKMGWAAMGQKEKPPGPMSPGAERAYAEGGITGLNRYLNELLRPEFAPGIPASREIQPIPEVKEPTNWDMVVQLHNALRAGPHWDMRFVDPTGWAHSFAVPKRRFPTANDRMLLALLQPTHTGDYARNFEGEIPEGTYGAGTVSKELQEKVKILSSSPYKIHFARPDGNVYALFRTQGNKWGLKQTA